jgi:hypothetical protein
MESSIPDQGSWMGWAGFVALNFVTQELIGQADPKHPSRHRRRDELRQGISS